MSHLPSLDRVQAEITSHFPHLTAAMRKTLGYCVYGMLTLQHCGQTQITILLAELLDEPFHNVRQRLRELMYEKEAK